MLFNLPNLLTLSRIAAIPLVVACFWLDRGWAQWLSAGLFVAACVTDWFDGYFARRYHQISRLGRFLDPIADKLLVAAALLMLVDSGHAAAASTCSPALIILCARDPGLRPARVPGRAAGRRAGEPARQVEDRASRWCAIAFLLVGDAAPPIVDQLGLVLIWIAAGADADHRLRLSAHRPAPHGGRRANMRRRANEGALLRLDEAHRGRAPTKRWRRRPRCRRWATWWPGCATRSAGHAEALAEGAAFGAAVDQRTATFDAPLAGAREVAFFPPFTGG